MSLCLRCGQYGEADGGIGCTCHPIKTVFESPAPREEETSKNGWATLALYEPDDKTRTPGAPRIERKSDGYPDTVEFGGRTFARKDGRLHGRGGRYVAVTPPAEGKPAEKCSQCGQSFRTGHNSDVCRRAAEGKCPACHGRGTRPWQSAYVAAKRERQTRAEGKPRPPCADDEDCDHDPCCFDKIYATPPADAPASVWARDDRIGGNWPVTPPAEGKPAEQYNLRVDRDAAVAQNADAIRSMLRPGNPPRVTEGKATEPPAAIMRIRGLEHDLEGERARSAELEREADKYDAEAERLVGENAAMEKRAEAAESRSADLLEALKVAEEALRLQDPRNATERYNRIADDFQRELRLWPPGRDRPAAMGADDREKEAQAAWPEFRNMWHERFFDQALARIRSVTGGPSDD